MNSLVFDINGVLFLAFDGDVDEIANQEIERAFRRDMTARRRQGLPVVGVLRLRRPGDVIEVRREAPAA